MVMKLDELRKLPKAELRRLYDEEAKMVVPSLNHYRDEIVRREQARQTRWLIALTISVLVATVISAIGLFLT